MSAFPEEGSASAPKVPAPSRISRRDGSIIAALNGIYVRNDTPIYCIAYHPNGWLARIEAARPRSVAAMSLPETFSSSEIGVLNRTPRTQRMRMDRHQYCRTSRAAFGERVIAACSTASLGLRSGAHGAISRAIAVPVPLVTIASSGGGELASWMHWPQSRCGSANDGYLGRPRAPARRLHRRQQSSRYGALTRRPDKRDSRDGGYQWFSDPFRSYARRGARQSAMFGSLQRLASTNDGTRVSRIRCDRESRRTRGATGGRLSNLG